MVKNQFSIQQGNLSTGEKAFSVPGNRMSFGVYSPFTNQVATTTMAKTSIGQQPFMNCMAN